MIEPHIERVGPFHAVVFDDWRTKLLNGRKQTGQIINHEGKTLWVLCGSVDDALIMHRRGQNVMGLNDHVTTLRRATFEAVLPLLPVDVAVAFSNGKDVDDDIHLSAVHHVPEGLRSVFVWEKGRYRIETETLVEGRLEIVKTRLGPGTMDPVEFAAKAKKAVAGLSRTAPAAYNDRLSELNVSSGAMRIIEQLRAPAARRLRAWLDQVEDVPLRNRKQKIEFGRPAFTGEIGVRSMSIEAVPRSTKLRTTIAYHDGSTLLDHGFDYAGMLPDTMLCGIDGVALNQIVNAAGIGSWPITKAINRKTHAHLAFRPDAVTIGRPVGLPAQDVETAKARLRALFELDLCTVQSKGVVDMFKGTDPDRRMTLNAQATTAYALSGLDAETIVYLIEETLEPSAETSIDLSAWFGKGATMRRLFGTLEVNGQGLVDLADTILMPGRRT